MSLQDMTVAKLLEVLPKECLIALVRSLSPQFVSVYIPGVYFDADKRRYVVYRSSISYRKERAIELGLARYKESLHLGNVLQPSRPTNHDHVTDKDVALTYAIVDKNKIIDNMIYMVTSPHIIVATTPEEFVEMLNEGPSAKLRGHKLIDIQDYRVIINL